MGSGPSVPADSLLGCLVNNLKLRHLTPDLKPVCYCNEIWLPYPLDNQSKWSPNGSLDSKILHDLYNFHEGTGKWRDPIYPGFLLPLNQALSLNPLQS